MLSRLEIKGWAATKMSELGRDREQGSVAYYGMVRHDKVSAALKKACVSVVLAPCCARPRHSQRHGPALGCYPTHIFVAAQALVRDDVGVGCLHCEQDKTCSRHGAFALANGELSSMFGNVKARQSCAGISGQN